MKSYLMFKDKNLSINLDKAFYQEVTLRDMEIQEIIGIMAKKDPLIKEVCNYCWYSCNRCCCGDCSFSDA